MFEFIFKKKQQTTAYDTYYASRCSSLCEEEEGKLKICYMDMTLIRQGMSQGEVYKKASFKQDLDYICLAYHIKLLGWDH